MENGDDSSGIIVKPSNSEQKIYSDFIKSVYTENSNKILQVQNEIKENTDFLTAWVHEIKTPITAIKLVTDKNNNEAIEIINEEIERIEDYVQKMLYYTRVNDFSKDYIINSFQMDKIVKQCIKKHSIIFIKKHIKLHLENLDFYIDTDIKWISFIIDQILSNALKYTKENGIISISMYETEMEFVLKVKDNGIGIKTIDIPRLFTRSFTGYNGRIEASNSTGLGLYLSQKLAKKLGHYITVTSKESIGTEVLVHFPKLSDYYKI